METKIELKVSDINSHKDAKVVAFVGDLDATNVENVLEQITDLFNNGFVRIIADFEKLRYVNSTGLGILLHFSKTAKERDGCFKIAVINENVYEIIEIIGAITLLDVYENVNDAIQSL